MALDKKWEDQSYYTSSRGEHEGLNLITIHPTDDEMWWNTESLLWILIFAKDLAGWGENTSCKEFHFMKWKDWIAAVRCNTELHFFTQAFQVDLQEAKNSCLLWVRGSGFPSDSWRSIFRPVIAGSCRHRSLLYPRNTHLLDSSQCDIWSFSVVQPRHIYTNTFQMHTH